MDRWSEISILQIDHFEVTCLFGRFGTWHLALEFGSPAGLLHVLLYRQNEFDCNLFVTLGQRSLPLALLTCSSFHIYYSSVVFQVWKVVDSALLRYKFYCNLFVCSTNLLFYPYLFFFCSNLLFDPLSCFSQTCSPYKSVLPPFQLAVRIQSTPYYCFISIARFLLQVPWTRHTGLCHHCNIGKFFNFIYSGCVVCVL